MATYAVLNSANVVENVISADTLEVAEAVSNCACVEYTQSNPAFIGWTYDNDTKKFTPPVEESTE